MKRDVDLLRQLLFDMERHGPDCSCDALRNGAAHETDERTRFHLRLLVDAGLAKEAERAAAGTVSFRLTNAGYEFLDLCRSGARWREAKWVVQEQTGGLSLSVLRAVLTKWALEGIARGERYRRWRRSYRPAYYRGEPIYRGEPAYRSEPPYRVDSYRYEREPMFDEEPAPLVRPRPGYRERIEPTERWDGEDFALDGELADSFGVSLPVHMI